ncbi:MAG: bifunctional methylenetetrahydrofolate dehydrogenase/methenyltetrahydrofolate cyclohydrolase FolD [Deltaproteobacteria bacterium]|nr:bifunctional methylenetetrahydrofolate dehydrogenase/methenyltetrahydrofolate cyclohydrolase FolD [Deltaproteobacteria bacterium]
MGNIIDGKAVAESIREALKNEVAAMKAAHNVTPGLAVVLVGEDPASKVYVKNKGIACEKAGIRSVQHTLSADTSEESLLKLIKELNADKEVHGILVQLPLPKHINSDKILETIAPEKDSDGFHPYNVGRLMTGRPTFEPCTPLGVMKLIEASGIELSGKDAVIIGRSNIVGKPMAMMLLQKNATVSICHSKTKDLEKKVLAADVVVAAIGKAEFVKGSWIKEGAVVIDVGINRTAEGKLVGDVEYEAAKKRASFITPVPGGVGPMTIAMLLRNTVDAAARTIKKG